MPWFYIDDAFADSKPVMALDARLRNEAVGLWTRCGAWSAKEETDGHVPVDVVRWLGGTTRIVLALHTQAGLWEVEDLSIFSKNWRESREILFKNWEKWQKTSTEISAKRRKDAVRQAEYRQKHPEKNSNANRKGRGFVSSTDISMSQCDNDVTNSVSHNVTDTDQQFADDFLSRSDSIAHPRAGVRPDPTHKEITHLSAQRASVGGSGGEGVVAHSAPTDASAKAKAKPEPATKGTRLSKLWRPSDAVVKAMHEQFPDIDLKAVYEEFCDYWLAIPGSRGRKLDWDATWRNRVREIAGRQAIRTNNGHTPSPNKLRTGVELAARLHAEEQAQLANHQPREIT